VDELRHSLREALEEKYGLQTTLDSIDTAVGIALAESSSFFPQGPAGGAVVAVGTPVVMRRQRSSPLDVQSTSAPPGSPGKRRGGWEWAEQQRTGEAVAAAKAVQSAFDAVSAAAQELSRPGTAQTPPKSPLRPPLWPTSSTRDGNLGGSSALAPSPAHTTSPGPRHELGSAPAPSRSAPATVVLARVNELCSRLLEQRRALGMAYAAAAEGGRGSSAKHLNKDMNVESLGDSNISGYPSPLQHDRRSFTGTSFS
jgi:hypothetical protein